MKCEDCKNFEKKEVVPTEVRSMGHNIVIAWHNHYFRKRDGDIQVLDKTGRVVVTIYESGLPVGWTFNES